MLSRDADAQQRQQGMHRGFRATDGAQGGLRSVDESNRSARVVKGVKGYVDCPFDLGPGLSQIHDACVRSLGGGGGAGDGGEAKPDTRAEQAAKSSTAAKLMAVVQSTSSKRKPEARSKDSYRAGVGAHRLTREAAAEQRKAIAPRLTFEQIAEEEVPLEDDDEDVNEGTADAATSKKKRADVDAATAIARMARLGAGISDDADAAAADEPHTRTEATREKERVARQLVRQSNAKQLAEYDAKRHRSEGFVRPPTEEEGSDNDDAAMPGESARRAAKLPSPKHRPSAPIKAPPKAAPKSPKAPVLQPGEEEALEEFADEPPADPSTVGATTASSSTHRPNSSTAGGNNKANKAELARLRGLYAKTKKRR